MNPESEQQLIYYGQYVEADKVREILNIDRKEMMSLVFEKKLHRIQLSKGKFLYDLKSLGVQYKLVSRNPRLPKVVVQAEEETQNAFANSSLNLDALQHCYVMFPSFQAAYYFSKQVAQFIKAARKHKHEERVTSIKLPCIVADRFRVTQFHNVKLEMLRYDKVERKRSAARITRKPVFLVRDVVNDPCRTPLIIKELYSSFAPKRRLMTCDRWTAIHFLLRLFKGESILNAAVSYNALRRPRIGIDDEAFEQIMRVHCVIKPTTTCRGDFAIQKMIHRLIGYAYRTFRPDARKKVTDDEELIIHKFLIDFRRNCAVLADLDIYKFLYDAVFKKPIDEEAVEDARVFANKAREKYIIDNSTKYRTETGDRRETHMCLGLQPPGPWDDLDFEVVGDE
jgi:hypothetical protein